MLLSLALHVLLFAWPISRLPSQPWREGDTSNTAISRSPKLTVWLTAPNPAAKRSPRETTASEIFAATPPPSVAMPDPDQADGQGIEPAYFGSAALTRMPEALSEFGPEVPDLPQARQGGRLTLRLRLDRDGNVDQVALLGTELSDILTEATLLAFRRMRFHPGEIRGRAVPSESLIVVEYAGVPDNPVIAAPSATQN